MPLLKSQFLLFVLVLRSGWQVVLAHHSLLHVFQEQSDGGLVVIDLALILGLLFFEALHEIVDLTLLLVENLVLLSLAILSTGTMVSTTRLLLLKILLNLLDVTLVRLDHLAHICDILLELLDLSIVLLDPVEEALACLGERQVHLVGLQLQVVLALDQGRLFFLQVLRSLLQGVLLQTRLSLDQARVYLFQVRTRPVYLLLK